MRFANSHEESEILEPVFLLYAKPLKSRAKWSGFTAIKAIPRENQQLLFPGNDAAVIDVIRRKIAAADLALIQ